jgi:L-2-hydroxycarboxylate dehydrogenase (NAD+)
MTSADPSSIVVVEAQEAHALIVDALRSRGATETDAVVQAEMLVEGDLRGQHSHGIRRLPVLAERLTNGVTTSGTDPVLTWTGDARVHVDGRRGLGPAVAHRAMEALIPAARTHGISIASVANAGHIGMLAPYVERLAAEGFIGIVLTVSEALVAPWGGKRAMVGTNPIGIGVPASPDPLILDMSTAAVSAGKIHDYAARGQAIPLGWAVDADGTPTTDAAAAADGAISAFGGPKGYALGLAFEAVVGLLAGSAFGRDVHGTLDTDRPPTKGDVFIAVPADRENSALAAYLELLRAEGEVGRPVLVPGDRARALRAERLRNGIPLDAHLWAEVQSLSSTKRRIG